MSLFEYVKSWGGGRLTMLHEIPRCLQSLAFTKLEGCC